MTSAIRVGDRMRIGFTQRLTSEGTSFTAMSGYILAVDNYGIRLDVGPDGIHFIPWAVVGVSTVLEEAPET